MKNHSKDPRYKEYLALENRRAEIWQAQRKNRIKLDEPYHRGYDHYLEPRFDIQNREDAQIFWWICEIFGETKYTRRKKPSKKEKKAGWNSLKAYQPKIRRISEEQYDKYIPAIQKHFTPVEWDFRLEPEYSWVDWGNGYCSETGNIKKVWRANKKGYKCTIPDFYFVTKTKKHMVEYGYEVDELLEQELAEINGRLEGEFRHITKWYGNVPKHFRKSVNKSKSAHNKRALQNILKLEDPEDIQHPRDEFLPYRSDAGWLWW